MRHVPEHALVKLASSGRSERAIARELHRRGIEVSRSTIHRRLQSLKARRLTLLKSTKRNRNTLSSGDVRYMVRLIRFQGFTTASRVHRQLRAEGKDVSYKTVLGKLKSIKTLRCGYARQRQALTAKQQRHRLEWARDSLAHHIEWSQVFFADEKVWQCDGPVRRPKQWYDIRDPRPRLPRRGPQIPGLAVWGAFS